jgi:hypothetical protein
MQTHLAQRSALFDALLFAWNDGDPERVHDLITADYRGHMLHLAQGERSGADYPEWIRNYRLANPGALFGVVDQSSSGDKLWTRLIARLPNGDVAHGVNISRFDGDRIAEEWAVWSPWLPDVSTLSGSSSPL